MTKGNSTRSSSASSSGGSGGGSGDNSDRYKRLKLDSSSELEGSPSSTDIATNTKSQSAFINKLYKMLEDPDTSHLIAWSSHGDLFSVSNPTAFSKTILPQYFKHNNWQSFVRQLNMYGFHKVNDLIHSNLTNENQTWEFKHPNFKRGEIDDLQNIKRKSTKNQQIQQYQLPPPQLQETKTDIDPEEPTNNDSILIKHVLRIEDHLLGVSKSCEELFSEIAHIRMVVSKQQDAMQDLVDVVSSLSTPNNNCSCYNKNANKQELQNAENLRIQVSKLKSNQPLKLPSFDALQQQKYQSNYKLNNNEGFLDYQTESDNTNSSDSSSTNSIQKCPNTEESKSKMSFGKQSHMLNPMNGSAKRNSKYK